MSTESRRPVSRRSAIRLGLGVAAGTGLAVANPFGARSAQAAQSGAQLCDNSGDSASAYGLGSGDLCIPYSRAHDGTWGYVWGDSYSGMQQSGYLGSPTMLCQSAFDSSGNTPIEFTYAMPSGRAEQLFDYTTHADNGFGYETSRIPNDCIEIDGRTYIQYTSVNTWDAKATTSGDGSLMAGIAYSDDYGVTWQDYDYHWAGWKQGIDQSLYMMWSFAGVDPDGWLYIFSKRWNGSHTNSGDDGAIQLFRIQPGDFRAGNFGAQQNWAWNGNAWVWTTAQAPSVILSGNDIGEFSVKNIGGTYCMSYFDVTDYSIRTRTASRPDAVWTDPTTHIVGDNVSNPAHWGLPQVQYLYGGYIHPGSASATSLTLIVSQWDGTIGSPPYWALQYDGINP